MITIYVHRERRARQRGRGSSRMARPVVRRHASGSIWRQPTDDELGAAHRRLPLPSALGRRRAQRAPVSEDRAVSRLPLPRPARHRRQQGAARVRHARRRLLPRAATTSSPCTTASRGASRDCASVCDRHDALLRGGPGGAVPPHRRLDGGQLPAGRSRSSRTRIDELEEQAFAGRERSWCGRCMKLKRELAHDAARPDPAARRDRPAGAARVRRDLRRDGLPLPRRLRPRRAADRRSRSCFRTASPASSR